MFININCNVYTHAYIVNKLNSVDYQFEEKKTVCGIQLLRRICASVNKYQIIITKNCVVDRICDRDSDNNNTYKSVLFYAHNNL